MTVTKDVEQLTRSRKLVVANVTSSVGRLGAVVAYPVLAIVGLMRHDPHLAGGSYLAMDVVGWFVIVALCFAALATGLVQSLGTEWGSFRHRRVPTEQTVGGPGGEPCSPARTGHARASDGPRQCLAS